jgi:hypothetical protein
MKKNWKRKCPRCGEEIQYTKKDSKNRAEKRNTKCKSCALLGRIFTDEHRKNLSKNKKGKKRKPFTDEWKENISKSNKGRIFTDEHRQKLSNAGVGRRISDETRKKLSNAHKGKVFTDEHKQKLKQNNSHYWMGKIREPLTNKHKQKIRESTKGKNNHMFGKRGTTNPNYGKKRSEETKLKMRLSRLKNIEKNNGQVSPGYNPVGCDIIRWYNMYYNFNFQHAENGGEKCIDGYFPDGVDEKRKTIIEIDEPRHFNSDGTYKKKDIRRQNYLEGLGYTFIRVEI